MAAGRERPFVRSRIHNFATVLEYDHPHATITRVAMTPPIGKGVVDHPDWLGMELELSILQPPRSAGPAPPPKPR